MLLVLWLLLFLAVASLVLLMPTLWGREIYNHYRGSRAVTCPETRRQVAVSFDALHAAVTGLSAPKPALRLSACTRWPTRANCGQECIPEALRAGPYTQGEVDLSTTKKIYHLPVLIASFVAWVLGAFWHSEFLFRERWMEALGLSDARLRQIVEWWAPHLISVAVPLLFSYGVAWLLACSGRKGLRSGILASTFLWVLLTVATLPSAVWAGISRDLLLLEAGYTFLASIAIGAIVGGLTGKLIEPAFQEK
ncbi:MAG: DUF1761 domain-containing protein [Acidobacteriia bacterium]|nr:DUF1761 domain-containing protein [Terriglobia bacterium]